MKYKILHIMLLTALLSACNTGRHIIEGHMSNEYPIVASVEMVRVYTEGEVAPDSSKIIGELWTDYEPRAKKISCDSTLNMIKEAVSAHGGNGFYVMEHRKPNHLETNNHYFEGLVLLTKDTTIYNLANNPFSKSYAEYNAALKRERVSPHNLHLDAGISFLLNEQPVLSETEPVINGTLKRGVGLNTSYTYLVPYSLYGFGVVYSGHHAKATVAERNGSTIPIYSVRNTTHSVVPVISMYGCSKNALMIASLGLGYMWNIVNWDYVGVQNKRDVESDLALYVSVEYEYRITQNVGVSGRLYLNQLSDSNGDDNPDIINGGLSLGINYHF